MTEMTTYAPGTPCWVDMSSPDLEASIAFYGELLGWEVPESENAEQTSGYRIATRDGKSAAGMMPQMQEGQPTAWMTHVSVEDADATAAAVRDAGGNVIVEPMDVMDLGRMAAFIDSAGAAFGAWQPGTFAGAELVNEPGTFSWNELNTRDAEKAKAFYNSVFGWEAREMDMGDAGTYTTFHPEGADADDRGIAGLLDMTPRQIPEEVPPHWVTYFTVDELEPTISNAEEAGGHKMFGPLELPMGKLAILTDPHGAAFGVWQTTGTM